MHLNITQLARRLNISRQSVQKQIGKPGFPDRNDKGEYDADAVAAWWSKNIRPTTRGVQRNPAPKPQGAPRREPHPDDVRLPPGGRVPRAFEQESASPSLADSDDPLVQDLIGEGASALTISRAAVKVAARVLAAAVQSERVGKNELDALNKTLQEARGSETSWMEIEVTKRKLYRDTDVQAAASAIGARAVQAMDLVENTIATEFAVWLADPATATLSQDELARKVRGFYRAKTNEARTFAAASIDEMLRQVREADDPGADGDDDDEDA